MTKIQRLVLLIAILASFVAFLDTAVINVALPAIRQAFGGGLASQQWIVDAYLLTLGSFILIAGSMSDIYGRKKILIWGLVGFGVASALCAIAPNNTVLIIARALQGLAGALLVPSSLALITNYIAGNNFTRAIGLWTAWTSIAFVVGPLLGGFLTDTLSWRWVFGINVVPIALTLFLIARLPAEEPPDYTRSVDILGSILCALSLGTLVFGLIEQPRLGWNNPLVYLSLGVGVILLVAFFLRERKATHAMLPIELFRARNFTVGNIATFATYAALTAVTFLLVVFLQQVAGYSALNAGMSLLPVTLIIFLLSGKIGGLSERFGPRVFMALGPSLAGLGVLCIALQITTTAHYVPELLPGVILLGLGLSINVTPLTAAILSTVSPARSGIASAVNNAVARIAGLIAVAAIGGILAASFSSTIGVSLHTTSPSVQQFLNEAKQKTLQTGVPENLGQERGVASKILEQASLRAFKQSLLVCAGLLLLAGIISAFGIKNKKSTANAL